MNQYRVRGGTLISGQVAVSGSKNAALPILAATLMTSERCIIYNVPRLRDTLTMLSLLEAIGKRTTFQGHTVIVDEPGSLTPAAPYDIVSTMRASICVMGPLLGRFGECRIALPGGCAFGPRPIDLHLKAMEALGSTVSQHKGDLILKADTLFGTDMDLSGPAGPTVLGTDNAAMAAAFGQGQTTINQAAREPEVQELLAVLQAMGATIQGAGTGTVTVSNQGPLSGFEHALSCDRIEAGTWMALGALLGDPLTVTGVPVSQLTAFLESLAAMGVSLSVEGNCVTVSRPDRLHATNVQVGAYPGFATDLQPIIAVLMTQAHGQSQIADPIYPSRFQYAAELTRMGASIQVDPAGSALIEGPTRLEGARVMAGDLRAGAALVLAAATAQGETIIRRSYHVERGYESMIQKLESVDIQAVCELDPDGPVSLETSQTAVVA